jgi:hypothetical protein
MCLEADKLTYLELLRADSYYGSRVLDAPAHLLSRDLVSQSASDTCCTLARVAVFFMLHVISVLWYTA